MRFGAGVESAELWFLQGTKVIARQKGADAIINAKTEAIQYYGYYGDELLKFKGELIVYAPAVTK